jgi:hypothetical protein
MNTSPAQPSQSTPIAPTSEAGPTIIQYQNPNESSPIPTNGSIQLPPIQKEPIPPIYGNGTPLEDVSMTGDGPSYGGFTAVNRS